jgi:hypothetical protein
MQFFRIASILLIVISLSHIVGHLFLIPQLQMVHSLARSSPPVETGEKLMSLMQHYYSQVGGSDISIMEIQTGLSLCYSLFFLWTGILNLMIARGLSRNKRLLAQISMLNAVVLVAGAIVSYVYFFWLPIVSFLVTAGFFVVASIRMQKEF